jgi:ATP-dependent protease HslVU (ClpYQ) peptidase subunit
MTIIVAATDGETTYVVSDTLYSSNNSKVFAPKIIHHMLPTVLIGMSGDAFVYDILASLLSAGFDPSKEGLRSLGQSIFKQAKDDFLVLKERPDVSELLFVLPGGKMYTYCTDERIFEHSQYCAIGCGQDYALGSLYTNFKNSNPKLSDLSVFVKEAAEAACKFSPSCEKLSKVFTI